MSIGSRSIKRKLDLRIRKEAQKSLRKQEQLLTALPASCLKCGCEFNKNEQSNLDSWTVSVQYEQNEVELICPTCNEANAA